MFTHLRGATASYAVHDDISAAIMDDVGNKVILGTQVGAIKGARTAALVVLDCMHMPVQIRAELCSHRWSDALCVVRHAWLAAYL